MKFQKLDIIFFILYFCFVFGFLLKWDVIGMKPSMLRGIFSIEAPEKKCFGIFDRLGINTYI